MAPGKRHNVAVSQELLPCLWEQQPGFQFPLSEFNLSGRMPAAASQHNLEVQTASLRQGRRTLALGGINFAGSPFIFVGYSGAPFSNRSLNLAAAGWRSENSV